VAQLLATPGLEAPEGATPEQMLRVAEAYWTVSTHPPSYNPTRGLLSLARCASSPDDQRTLRLPLPTAAPLQAMRDPRLAAAPGPTVVTRSPGSLPAAPEFDVVVAGGNLGVILALALQRRGHRVCVVEKRLLRGRRQEWNTSRSELACLVRGGLLSAAQLEGCIVTEWARDRMGFKGGKALWVEGVLNVGVSPAALVAALRAEFEAAGGVVLERCAFRSARVLDDGVEVALAGAEGGMPLTPGDVNRPTALGAADAAASRQRGSGGGAVGPGGGGGGGGEAGEGSAGRRRGVSCRLLLDCMGHFSPVVKQIRAGQRPDGMVVVVGGCMEGVPAARNTSADLLYTFDDSADDLQLFWEAFPAEGGRARTAYAFAYTDAHPSRPSFAALLDTFLEQLPRYQGAPLEALTFKRILVGGFPCYARGSPLPPAFDRVLQVGDASAAQSPLSFGGFGSMLRHLPRLADGVDEALGQERLGRGDLAWLQPYQPALSVSWLFQRAMSIKPGQLRREAQPPSTAPSASSEPPAAAAVAAVAAAASPPAAPAGQQPARAAGLRGQPAGGGWLPAGHINRLMRCNFAVMRALGDRVLRPFVQDSMQLGPLALTMLGMMLRDPVVITRVAFQVGPLAIARWFAHFVALAACTAAGALLRPLRPLVRGYRFRRLVDALSWGASADYDYAAAAAGGSGSGSGSAAGGPAGGVA
jgi:lycopene cyclase CruP